MSVQVIADGVKVQSRIFSKCVQFLIPAYENIKRQLDECGDVREKQIPKKVVRKIQKEDITIGRIKIC